MGYWDLPGSAKLVAAVVDTLLARGCVVATLSGHRNGFEEAVAEAFERRDVGTLSLIDVSDLGPLPPAEALARRVLPREARVNVATASSLVQSAALEGETVLVRGVDQHWPNWDIFLRAFVRARKPCIGAGEPLRIAVVTTAAAARTAGYTVLDDAEVPSRLDTALYVSEAMRDRRRGAFDLTLLQALVVELSGWNLDLADALARLPEHTLLDPFDWLSSQRPLTVTVREWGGVAFPCSIAAAKAGDQRTIARRVWRAQLHIVFPWLEEVRLLVVERYRGRLAPALPLQTPYGTTIVTPEDLEFGALVYLLRNQIDRRSVMMLARLGDIRNSLAHREPVEAAPLRTAQTMFDAWYREIAGESH